MERLQLQKAQPMIEAQNTPVSPQANMAAPVDVPQDAPSMVNTAAPRDLPTAEKTSPAISSETEREFRRAMELFQSGRNTEASAKFAVVAKKYPQHLLASHSLYWAGEANARSQQWSSAVQNWEELENKYPRSAYLPEALAGLSRAHEQQGNTGKARAYRDSLVRAFPKSPLTLNFRSAQTNSSAASAEEVNAPAYEEEKSESANEEQGEEE
jgi:TolA-binding protein